MPSTFTPFHRPLLQARRRLCRRILLGLQALQEARCLTPSLLATLRSFLATAAAVAGSDSYGEGSSHRSSGAAAAAAAAAAAGGPDTGPQDGVVFAGLGRLPLRHLLELYAFLGILLGTDFASPAALLPELQVRYRKGRGLFGQGGLFCRKCWLHTSGACAGAKR